MTVLVGRGSAKDCFVCFVGLLGGVGLDRGQVLVCEELRGCGTGGFVGSGMGIGFDMAVVLVVVIVDVIFVVGLVGSGTGGAVGPVGSVVGMFLELSLISATVLGSSPGKMVVRS